MGKITIDGKDITKPFYINGKKVVKIEIDGKVLSLLQIQNSFTGTFSSKAKEDEFMSITTHVANNQFKNEAELTSISLPSVTSIDNYAFENSYLTSLSLPSVTSIGNIAFYYSRLTSLSLPSVTSIGYFTFRKSPLTYLNIPNVTIVGDNTFDTAHPFWSIVNSHSTKVIMPGGPDENGVRFDSTRYKDYMFGPGNWDQISFTWL